MFKYVWQASRWVSFSSSAKHEIFSGKWAFVSFPADSGGGLSLKNFSGKRRPPVRWPNSIQRGNRRFFKKVALVGFGAESPGLLCLFRGGSVAPWAWLANKS